MGSHKSQIRQAGGPQEIRGETKPKQTTHTHTNESKGCLNIMLMGKPWVGKFRPHKARTADIHVAALAPVLCVVSFCFGDKVSCSLSRPRTHYAAKDGLTFLIVYPPSPLTCPDYRHAPAHPVLCGAGIESRAS